MLAAAPERITAPPPPPPPRPWGSRFHGGGNRPPPSPPRPALVPRETAPKPPGPALAPPPPPGFLRVGRGARFVPASAALARRSAGHAAVCATHATRIV